MAEFVAGILAFPTVIFTLLLGLVAVYWLFVLLGLFDTELLDGLLGLDALEGTVAEGLVEGAADALEGATEALDGSESPGGMVGMLNSLGLLGVPLTIVGSIVIFVAWLTSYLTLSVFGGSLPGGPVVSLVLAVAVALGALGASMVASSILIRPLRRFFVTQQGPRRSSLVGKLCTVTTQRVDGGFGQAEIDDGGAGFLAQVRCAKPNQLTRGSKALVFHYDGKEEVFQIAPLDRALERATQGKGED